MKLRIIAGWPVAGLIAVGVALAGPGSVATASPAAGQQAAESGVLSHCAEIPTHPGLGRGDRGPVVVHAQCLLVRHWGQGIVIDGIFGPATEQAIRNVQRWCGLPVDGIVGPLTWRVLHKHGVC